MAQILLFVAIGLYCVNNLVGLIAQLRWYHFGKAHHILYFFVFLSAIVASLFNFHPALLLTLAALAMMPKSKPWTWKHPVCAVLGGLGYLITLLFRW